MRFLQHILFDCLKTLNTPCIQARVGQINRRRPIRRPRLHGAKHQNQLSTFHGEGSKVGP